MTLRSHKITNFYSKVKSCTIKVMRAVWQLRWRSEWLNSLRLFDIPLRAGYEVRCSSHLDFIGSLLRFAHCGFHHLSCAPGSLSLWLRAGSKAVWQTEYKYICIYTYIHSNSFLFRYGNVYECNDMRKICDSYTCILYMYTVYIMWYRLRSNKGHGKRSDAWEVQLACSSLMLVGMSSVLTLDFICHMVYAWVCALPPHNGQGVFFCMIWLACWECMMMYDARCAKIFCLHSLRMVTCYIHHV